MRKAMVVHGGWQGHEPEEFARLYRSWLGEDGFEVRMEATTAAFADPEIAGYSLIVPVLSMARIEKAEAANLCAAVRGGVGLAGHHGLMGDTFRDAVEYQFMCGGQFVAHPGGIIDFRVEVAKPEDPVMAGIAGFAYRSEQYFMHVDPGNEVLATTTFLADHAPWTKGIVMPVVWKKRYGEGRVFYSALGHSVREFDEVPAAATILRRGLNWAAR